MTKNEQDFQRPEGGNAAYRQPEFRLFILSPDSVTADRFAVSTRSAGRA